MTFTSLTALLFEKALKKVCTCSWQIWVADTVLALMDHHSKLRLPLPWIAVVWVFTQSLRQLLLLLSELPDDIRVTTECSLQVWNRVQGCVTFICLEVLRWHWIWKVRAWVYWQQWTFVHLSWYIEGRRKRVVLRHNTSAWWTHRLEIVHTQHIHFFLVSLGLYCFSSEVLLTRVSWLERVYWVHLKKCATSKPYTKRGGAWSIRSAGLCFL